MKAVYRETAKPGHGLLVFSEAMFPEEPWQISIQRASDRKFLTGNSGNPWISEAFFISLQGKSEADGSLVINVGPDIVNQLDQQEIYRASLRGADGTPLKASLGIPAITYSREKTLDNTTGVREAAPQPEPEPEPEPEPAPEAASERTADAGTEQTHEQGQELEELSIDAVEPENSAKNKYWRWAIIAVLILGCLAWYFLDPRFKDDSSRPDVPQAASPDLNIGERVSQFFRNQDRTPAGAVELAEKMEPASSEERDAVYKLYYYAAEAGYPGAMLKYGECMDPSMPQWGTIQKDAVIAWAAYNKSQNHERADLAIAHLREWLESQAASGNGQAAAWLRDIGK